MSKVRSLRFRELPPEEQEILRREAQKLEKAGSQMGLRYSYHRQGVVLVPENGIPEGD